MGRGFSRGFNSGFLHSAETVFSALEAEDIGAFSATLRDFVVLEATEAADIALFSIEVEGEIAAGGDGIGVVSGGGGGSSGNVILPPEPVTIAKAVLTAREEPDRAAFVGRSKTVVVLRNIEQPDVARFTGKVAHRGNLSLVEAPDTATMKADPFDMRARNNALLLMAA